jgi:hypothetical protein
MLDTMLIFISRTVLECVTCYVCKTVFHMDSSERTLAGREKKTVLRK